MVVRLLYVGLLLCAELRAGRDEFRLTPSTPEQVAALRTDSAKLIGGVIDQGLEEAGLALEVIVESRLGHAGPVDDLLD